MKRIDDFLQNKIIREDMENILSRSDDYTWLNDSSVLISGAYGMLASYVVYFLIYLCEKGIVNNVQILAQGRNEEKMCNRFGKYFDKSYFVYISDDICSPIKIDKKIDYIIHAASLASPQYYGTNPVDVLKPNTLGTYNLLELARENSVKSFLYFSSGDVYGYLPLREQMYDENDYGYVDPTNVRSCYGESKRMGETMCVSFFEQYSVPAKIVRIAHTYGPTLDLENDKRMFAEFVKNIVKGEDIEMKSDGMAERMLCYIADATDAFLRILCYGENGQAYNMYNNSNPIKIKDLAEMLVNLYPEKGLKVKYCIRDSKDSYVESPVVKSPIMDTKKLQKLGWKVKYSNQEGFKRTIDSFKC